MVEFKSTLGKPVSYVLDIGAIKRTWTGQDLEDFIAVSLWTGLRISDVATFRVDGVTDEGGILVRITKGVKPVYTGVPEWLLSRIRDRAAKHGSWIFGKPNTTSVDVITENWRRKLNKLWAACGPWKVNPRFTDFVTRSRGYCSKTASQYRTSPISWATRSAWFWSTIRRGCPGAKSG